MPVEIDLLAIDRGIVTAPAGCGKTHLIADALMRHTGSKPILVLTHTNAGVAALRTRLDHEDVPASRYRLSTIDGWAIRLAKTFPRTSGVDPAALLLHNRQRDYPLIRDAAWRLLHGRHIDDVLRATYDRLIVDEYQDCGQRQHGIVCNAASALRTVLLGDPMQAILVSEIHYRIGIRRFVGISPWSVSFVRRTAGYESEKKRSAAGCSTFVPY